MTTPYFSMQHADVVEAAEKLEAERDRYRTALKRYGRHDLKCATQVRFTKPDACDCGLYEAFR